MKRLLLALALAAFATAPLAASSAAADGPRLSRGGDAKFPQRSFLLSLPPGNPAESTDVRVLENGDQVRGLTVTPAGSTSAGEFGTVLAIDASNSMRGAPIERAMAAARAFAEHRSSTQKLGIVTFNRSAETLLEPTTDDAAIVAALAEPPPLAKQTHVRDGALAALKALERAQVEVGSVVVLSDGADTGSQASLGQVAAAADDRGVRVFTVGLESRDFDADTLASLAKAGEGRYTAAPSAEDLAQIYDDLGAQLAAEYLIRYSSVAGTGKRIEVQAVVEGAGSATLTYRSPKNIAPPVSPAEPEANGFWASAIVMLVVGFGTAFLICFAVAWLLMQRRQPETAEERVAAFVAMGAPEGGAQPEEETPSHSLLNRLELALRGRAWWRRFALDVEISGIEREPAQIGMVTLIATLFTMWLFAAVSAPWVALFALLIPWGVRRFVGYRAAKQRVLFGEQLADNLQVVASAMRAGQSFAGALAVAVEDAAEPAKGEFQRVVADEQLGVPIETSLSTVVERMENRDLHQVALVASVQRAAGGNAAEVLERVAETIRERVALRRLISTLTAQGRMSRWVVSLIPVVLLMLIGLANPGYLDPLFNTTAGNVMLVVAVLMGVSGSLAIKKIVDIKV